MAGVFDKLPPLQTSTTTRQGTLFPNIERAKNHPSVEERSFLGRDSSDETRELFPQVQTNRSLDEQPSKVDFNRPSWSQKGNKAKDPLAHLPARADLVLAKLVGMITEYQGLKREDQLEILKAMRDHSERLRESLSKLENSDPAQSPWSYYLEVIEDFLDISGVMGAAMLLSAAPATGGTSALPAYQMLVGSSASLGAKYAGKYFGGHPLTSVVRAGGKLLSACTSTKAIVALANTIPAGSAVANPILAALGSIPEVVSQSAQLAVATAKWKSDQEQVDAKARVEEDKAEHISLKFEKDQEDRKLSSFAGGMNNSKAHSLIEEAAKNLRNRQDVNARILEHQKA